MTRIDFYLLPQSEPSARELFACRLINKAFQLGHQVYLLTADSEQSRQLDHMLWTFSASSFVPHLRLSDEEAPQTPVLIGHEEPPASCHDLLVSLTPEIPQFFSRFNRVAEMINNDGEQRQQARERYRFYRDRGYALETHAL